jgi:molecular chaperone GrpE
MTLPKRNARPAEESPEMSDQETMPAADQQQEELSRESAQEELIRLLTLEKDQVQDQLLRTMADLQNFRKRAQQEKDQLRQFASEQLVIDLLPVLDNFERTLAAIQSGASVEAVKGGIQAVERQLRSVLETRRVKRIEAVGQAFDPEMHEALGSVQTAAHPEGAVAEEIEPGYKMADKIIRPARVKVARKP